MDDIAQRVLAIISTMTAIDALNISPQARLREDLGLDRVGTLELISAVAEAFQLDVEPVEAKRIRDVQDLIALARVRSQDAPR